MFAYAKKYRDKYPERVKQGNQTLRHRFSVSKYTAKQRGISWRISLNDYEKFFHAPCFYCGEAFKTSGIGLDRVDNKLGYTVGNSVSCCWPCNNIKGSNYTQEETKVMVRALKRVRKFNRLNRERFKVT